MGSIVAGQYRFVCSGTTSISVTINVNSFKLIELTVRFFFLQSNLCATLISMFWKAGPFAGSSSHEFHAKAHTYQLACSSPHLPASSDLRQALVRSPLMSLCCSHCIRSTT